jgi:meiotic recombination protein SPO11
MPDICTRQLANIIWKKFNLPSYCLIDANPYGIQIMIVYKYGSAVSSINFYFYNQPVATVALIQTDIRSN